jgi:hypothetical protein
MCTLTDGENFEKTFIFGGIAHSINSKNDEFSNDESNVPKFK